jgi:hypothetical protein
MENTGRTEVIQSELPTLVYRCLALVIASTLAAGTLGPASARASGATARALDIPEVLRAPANQELMIELPARGVQVYECASSSEAVPRFEWKFKGPEAELSDRAGRPMGTHYGGPTWQAPDGSAIVGEVRARANAADPKSIPLLLLDVKASNGNGLFSKVRSIQRLETAGGTAPAEPCTAQEVTRVARVPYTATYYFYVDRP